VIQDIIRIEKWYERKIEKMNRDEVYKKHREIVKLVSKIFPCNPSEEDQKRIDTLRQELKLMRGRKR